MQISLRSHLIAGVAAVGATAIVISPVVQPDVLPSMQRVSSAVQLIAFDSPVAVLLATVNDVTANVFSQEPLPGTMVDDPRDLYWPDSFYIPDFSFVFAPGYLGVIPDFGNQVSFGGLSGVVSNVSGYVYAATEGLTALVSGPTTALFNTPFALITAAGYAAAGRVDLALAELQTQILGPLQQGITTALAAAGYIIDNAIRNVGTVLTNAIPGLLSKVINETLIPGALYIGQTAITAISTAVTQLSAGQFDAAWNTALNGLLGPSGTLGLIEKLTVGIGVIQDVSYPEGVVPTVVIPSLRADLNSTGLRLGDLSFYGDGGIRNEAFTPLVTASPLAAVTAASAVAAPKVSAAKVARPAASAGGSVVTEKVTETSVSEATSSDAAAPAKAKTSRGHARGVNAGN